MTDTLLPVLAPRSVAIVGASDDPRRIGGRPLLYMKEAGVIERLYPVNPNRDTVQGLRSFRSVAELPEAVDCAVIAVPAAQVPGAVRDLGAKGCKGAVIFSSGFAEAGGEGVALQEDLKQAAREGGVRVVGPNCLGVFNARTGFHATFTSSLDTALPTPGGVAIVSQSGAYGSHVFALARARRLGTTYWITTGNEADVEIAECIAWLAGREEVDVIVAYAEGIRDAARLRAALDLARRNRKPVVFQKVGRTAVGAAAAASHTAALAGEDAVYEALFRQYGVHRAYTQEEMLDVAYAASRRVLPTGRRIGLVTISGGVGVQMADAAVAAGLDVAPMPETAQATLKAALPFAATRNPVDITAQAFNDLTLVQRNMEIMLADGGYDAIVAFFTMVAASRFIMEPLIAALGAPRAAHPDKLIVLSILADEAIVRRYEDAGYLVFEDPSRAVAAIAALCRFAESFARAGEEDPVPSLPADALAPPAGPIGEHAAKRILAAAGLPVVPERLARTPGEAAAAATALGLPAAVKIASPDILHKTEVGGVALGLADAAAVERAAAEVLARARAALPQARIEGVLVSPMVAGGVEMVLGVQRDPVFGPVVMAGLGGILVEVLEDVAFRLAPFGRREARRMLDELKGRRVLDGVRGRPPADIDALADALARLSSFAAAHGDRIESVDVNPLVVLPAGEGALALDALIVPRRG